MAIEMEENTKSGSVANLNQNAYLTMTQPNMLLLNPGTIRKSDIAYHDYFIESISNHPSVRDYRVMSIDCPACITLDGLIDHLTDHIAQIAFALWPDWFERNPFNPIRILGDSKSTDGIERHFEKISENQNEFSRSWLKDAISLCQKNRKPLLDKYPRQIQVSFLAKAIHPTHLIVLLNFHDSNPEENRLYNMLKAIEWFVSHTNASVVILVPPELIEHHELASVCDLTIDCSVPQSRRLITDESRREYKSAVGPIVGKPHPFSPGEQLLAEYVAKDCELVGLFQFNQRIVTVRNNAYLVDLLWPSGQLVIEVDGFQFHRNREAFIHDRHRDYELMISGYKTLRLDHDEVMSDVILCIEKIKDVVNYIKHIKFEKS